MRLFKCRKENGFHLWNAASCYLLWVYEESRTLYLVITKQCSLLLFCDTASIERCKTGLCFKVAHFPSWRLKTEASAKNIQIYGRHVPIDSSGQEIITLHYRTFHAHQIWASALWSAGIRRCRLSPADGWYIGSVEFQEMRTGCDWFFSAKKMWSRVWCFSLFYQLLFFGSSWG